MTALLLAAVLIPPGAVLTGFYLWWIATVLIGAVGRGR